MSSVKLQVILRNARERLDVEVTLNREIRSVRRFYVDRKKVGIIPGFFDS